MKSEELKNLQAPLKDKYRDRPETAVITLRAEGKIGEGISCKLGTGSALVEAGLHPATGGDGMLACSGDLLLEALVACAGVTLRAVSTAIGIEIRDGLWKPPINLICRRIVLPDQFFQCENLSGMSTIFSIRAKLEK
jgi:hypothetical protein